MQIVDKSLPQDLQEAMKAIKPAYWLKRACSRYRRNSSLHLGLGIQRTISRKTQKLCTGAIPIFYPNSKPNY